jgi:2-methylcitrate dehydratase PrpD
MMLQNASFQTVGPQWLDRWADFAGTVTVDSLPRDVVARSKQVLFDCIGAMPGLRPARVKITLVDGRVLNAEAYTNRGDTEDPYSAEEVQDKFREVAESVWSDQHCSSILEVVADLDRSPDLAALSRPLAA